MAELLDYAMKASLVVFMAGSLLQMGLGLKIEQALSGLRDARFLILGTLFGFLIGPALAWGITRLLPLDEPFAAGLLLLGLTPCAPFLPMMVTRARGDVTYVPAMMLLAAIGTVVLLPFAVPLIFRGLSVSSWAIAQPLIALVLLPLVIGMTVYRVAPRLATAVLGPVQRTTTAATILLLMLCLVIYGQDFAMAFGQFAIVAQMLFFAAITIVGYVGGYGLTRERRSVLSLGMCTRNVGAALAPLMSSAATDERVIVMVILGVPMQLVFAIAASACYAHDLRGD